MEEKIIRFFEKKREVAAVYVFGSFASGRHRSDSDLDIGVLLHPEFLETAEALREQCMVQLGRILRKDIHLVILNHAGEVLLKQVLSKGKAILVKNPKVDKYFKMVSLSRIVDFNYHLEKMQAGLTKKILES